MAYELVSCFVTQCTLLLLLLQELARLWDWQHRRAALGLTPDLPHSSSSTLPHAAAATADTGSAAAAAAAEVDAEAAAAAAAAELQDAELSGSSSSSDDDERLRGALSAEELAEQGV
jgi:hypothetical protein